jgi:SARP family transcriptional regulator, regulator of embCAB operon
MTRPPVAIGVLGPVEAIGAGSPIPLGGPKPRAVIAALAANAGHVVSAAQLTEAVWGDDVDVARPEHTLQTYVSSLRKALGPDTLITQSPGYRLDAGGVDLDLAHFDALRSQGRDAFDHDPSTAIDAWTAALGRWRGPAFADLRDREWFDTRGARLDEQRLATEEDLCDALLSYGRHDDVIARLEALTNAHPFRERPRGQLMVALYRAGRQADALAVYRSTRELLIEELGIEPGDELRRIEAAVLDQDRSLLDGLTTTDGITATIDTRQLERRGALVLPDGQRVALAAGPTLIGRAPGSTVQLADNRVSRRHALVELVDGIHTVKDLGSTNGTTVNDEPVSESRALAPGDTISLGGFALRFDA